MMKRGLIERYESIEEFENKFRRQLGQKLNHLLPKLPTAPPPTAPPAGTQDENRPQVLEARAEQPEPPRAERIHSTLLREAVEDPNGVIIATLTMGGFSVVTRGKNLADHVRGREEAYWREAISKLQRAGLIEQRDRNGEVFAVTAAGYSRVEEEARIERAVRGSERP